MSILKRINFSNVIEKILDNGYHYELITGDNTYELKVLCKNPPSEFVASIENRLLYTSFGGGLDYIMFRYVSPERSKNSTELLIEIDHIFESGANEVRIFNMVEEFIKKRYVSIDLLNKEIEKIVELDRKGELQEDVTHVLFSVKGIIKKLSGKTC